MVQCGLVIKMPYRYIMIFCYNLTEAGGATTAKPAAVTIPNCQEEKDWSVQCLTCPPNHILKIDGSSCLRKLYSNYIQVIFKTSYLKDLNSCYVSLKDMIKYIKTDIMNFFSNCSQKYSS